MLVTDIEIKTDGLTKSEEDDDGNKMNEKAYGNFPKSTIIDSLPPYSLGSHLNPAHVLSTKSFFNNRTSYMCIHSDIYFLLAAPLEAIFF